ncbi:hypothetical protein BCD91_002166 [Clostridium beijerinckii]|nr:hypothetical protein [Clostridium beijerinckii]
MISSVNIKNFIYQFYQQLIEEANGSRIMYKNIKYYFFIHNSLTLIAVSTVNPPIKA